MARGAGESAEKIIEDIRRRTRRKFSGEEKIRIVLERSLHLPDDREDGQKSSRPRLYGSPFHTRAQGL